MIPMRRQPLRTTARQAAVVLYDPDPNLRDVSLSLALDNVGALVGVNGITLGVGCVTPEAARQIGETLPAGVDLRIAPARSDDSAAVSFARFQIEQGFERILVLAADSLGVSARLISTAFSMLSREPMVLGSTRADGVYLVGLRAEALENARSALAMLSGAELDAASPSIRHAERLVRARDVHALDELRSTVARLAAGLPRTHARLSAGAA